MYITAQQEQFQIAYVRAIAAAAGCSIKDSSVDDDSTDLTLIRKGGNGRYRSPQIELQLKCTYTLNYSNLSHSFQIKKKNYDDLRSSNNYLPKILVVLIVPRDVNLWTDQNYEKTSLFHSCYWLSLKGFPTRTEKRLSVRIPNTNLFTVEILSEMMDKVSQGIDL